MVAPNLDSRQYFWFLVTGSFWENQLLLCGLDMKSALILVWLKEFGLLVIIVLFFSFYFFC